MADENCPGCSHPWHKHRWDGALGRPARCIVPVPYGSGGHVRGCPCTAQRPQDPGPDEGLALAQGVAAWVRR